MNDVVAFGITTDPLALADAEIQSDGLKDPGEMKRFRNRTGGFLDEVAFDVHEGRTLKYLAKKSYTRDTTNHKKGGTVNGYVIDSWSVDAGAEGETTISVECHKNT